MRFNIGPSLKVGDGLPCALIAEISNNHNGDLGRALRLLDAAKASGASAAKVQTYSPEELVTLRGDGPAPEPWGSQGWTMKALYEKAMTPRHLIVAMFAHAESIGLPIFSSVFGTESLKFLEDIGCPAYKVSSFERDAAPLRKAVQETGKPWIVSRPDYAEPNIPTLYCKAGYPQVFETYDLVNHAVAGFFGFSYHGTENRTPLGAAILGSRMIEVHFQLDDEPSELEANVSITASTFTELVRLVRRLEIICGPARRATAA